MKQTDIYRQIGRQIGRERDKDSGQRDRGGMGEENLEDHVARVTRPLIIKRSDEHDMGTETPRHLGTCGMQF